MATSLGDRTRTKILTAEQLGTPSNHVAVAYIDSIIPTPSTEDLQATCNVGNTTTTPIICDSLTTTTSVSAGTTVTAGTGITSTTGDIVAEVGKLSVGITSGSSATGNIINYGTGSIIAEQGHVRAFTYVKADTGNIEATLGNITATAGNITAPTGGVTAGGNSKFNRMEYSYYYGGSTYAAPIALTNVLPYVAFSLPPNIYTFVLFYTHALVGVSSFPFELHTTLTDVLKDYNILVSSHTADNNGGQSLGYNNIVSGDSLSDPTNKSKITVIINTSGTYASQTLKCIVQLVYSPSP